MASHVDLALQGRPGAAARRCAFRVAGSGGAASSGAIALPVLHHASSPAAASFRSLRHRLSQRGDPRFIAISSAGPNEGKTTVAANLALAMAEQGEQVLLVEANRSGPRLADAFGIEVPACVGAQLRSGAEVETPEWWAVRAGLPLLHVLAADPWSPMEDAASPSAYRRLLAGAESAGYRRVIFDCAHVGAGGDLSLFADRIDGVVLSALGGVTRAQALRRAIELLAPTPVLGVVLCSAEGAPASATLTGQRTLR